MFLISIVKLQILSKTSPHTSYTKTHTHIQPVTEYFLHSSLQMQNYEEWSKTKREYKIGFDFVANFSFLLWFRLQANYVKSEKIEIG